MVARIRAFFSRMWEAYCRNAVAEYEATGGWGYFHGL